LNNAYTCLNTHNVFLSASENKDSWKTVRENYKVTSDDPFNFYVHRASATDETAAPKGCDSIMVLVPCATLNRNKEWSKLNREDAIKRYKEQFSDEYVQSIKRKVLERMTVLNGLKDLELHIINEVIDTPGSYADLYNVGAGTPFALSHGFAQLSFTRPSLQSDTDSTIFVGASTKPGNGVPLVLVSAKLAAQKAIRKLCSK